MISYKFENMPKWIKLLNDMQGRAINILPIASTIGELGKRDVVNHFRDEMGVDQNNNPQRWKKLKYPRKRGGTKILQDRGFLRAGTNWKIDNKNIILYNRIEYASIHQEGGQKIPQRKFLWLSSDIRKKMLQSIFYYIIRGKI